MTVQPSGSARVLISAIVCGWQFSSTKNAVCLGFRHALGHGHGFGGGGRLVEQRGIGDVEAGQVADHRLVVQQRFQAALADFRLVRRIGRVPGRIFQNVALDHRRRDRAVVALADQRHELLVAVGRLAHLVERLALGHRSAPGKRRPSGGSTAEPCRRSARRGCHSRSTLSIAAISSGEGPI